mgnify:CR=1 FL=1
MSAGPLNKPLSNSANDWGAHRVTVAWQMPRTFAVCLPPFFSKAHHSCQRFPKGPVREKDKCGGEQTLTALALIFAVFLANPAPICVLDEVDAPLDDANINRFCEMLDEMCRRTDTRFLIITHHAVTMARMDRLFGVTMQEQGVSQLVSVDLKRAETLVA